MGKISEHHEQMERDRKTTVAEFAQELRKSVDVLMVQLKQAGIKKTSENDDLTGADKQKLLQFLQKSHGSGQRRKKITLKNESDSDRLLKSIKKEENGAERACLEYFAGIVIAGVKVDAKLQEVVNLIIAKTLIFGALPMRKLGRPKLEKSDDKGKEVAEEYWVLRDGGSSYNDAVRHLADKIHKNERQVMRLVAKHKDSVGLTFEEREKNRHRFVQLYLIPPLSRDPVFLKSLDDMYTLPPAPEFTVTDYIEFLDEKLMKLIQQEAPTVTKD